MTRNTPEHGGFGQAAQAFRREGTPAANSSDTSEAKSHSTGKGKNWRRGLSAGVIAVGLLAPGMAATMGNGADGAATTAAKDSGKGIANQGRRETGAIIANTVCYTDQALNGLHDFLFRIKNPNGDRFHNCVGYVDGGGPTKKTLKIAPGGALPLGVTDASFQSGNEVDFGSGSDSVSFVNVSSSSQPNEWQGDGVIFPVVKGKGIFVNAADQAVVFTDNTNPATIDVTQANVPIKKSK
jgi:hypothetical protein